MTADPVHVVTNGSVATVTWQNPNRRNAIGLSIARRLTEELGALAERPEIALVHLDSASGPFCAGFDLTDVAGLAERTESQRAEFFATGRALMAVLTRSPSVLLATPRAYALGFGCALLARCDIVLAADDTTFGIPEIRAGVVPTTVLPDLLAAMVDRTLVGWAVDGARRTAAEAMVAGLVTTVVPAACFARERDRLIADLTERAPLAARTKAAVRAVAAAPPAERPAVAVSLAMSHLSSLPSSLPQSAGAAR